MRTTPREVADVVATLLYSGWDACRTGRPDPVFPGTPGRSAPAGRRGLDRAPPATRSDSHVATRRRRAPVLSAFRCGAVLYSFSRRRRSARRDDARAGCAARLVGLPKALSLHGHHSTRGGLPDHAGASG